MGRLIRIVLCYSHFKTSIDGLVKSIRRNKKPVAILLNGRGASSPSTDLYVNWGNPKFDQRLLPPSQILNNFDGLVASGSKVESFLALHKAGVRVPEFSTKSFSTGNPDSWAKVVSRIQLSACQGRGIKITIPKLRPKAPLYVQHIEKDKEYRIHVFKGRILLSQEKQPRGGKVNYEIRNGATGWGFTPESAAVIVPDEVKKQALLAVVAVGLDFGAVDVITDHAGRVYVLEVNSAPGLKYTSPDVYAKAFCQYLETT